MQTLIFIALGGAIGASARYLLSGRITHALGDGFPYGTLAVNIIGAFLMGLLVALFAQKISLPGPVQSGLTTGLLGGFTTFSAFSLEAVLLIERGQAGLALLYALVSVIFCVAALFAALYLIRIAG